MKDFNARANSAKALSLTLCLRWSRIQDLGITIADADSLAKSVTEYGSTLVLPRARLVSVMANRNTNISSSLAAFGKDLVTAMDSILHATLKLEDGVSELDQAIHLAQAEAVLERLRVTADTMPEFQHISTTLISR